MKTLKLAFLSILISGFTYAGIFVGKANSTKSVKSVSAGCSPATKANTLELNNVRTRITTASDMWWDNANSPRYEIPKNSGKHVFFAASLWVAGIDAAGQLKVAAVRYRQDGNDFWPGPLNLATAEIDAATCSQWDKHFRITKREVEEFVAWKADPEAFGAYELSANINNWPGNGDVAKGQANFLAPFYDADGNGIYSPGAGDYPKYDLSQASTGGSCTDFLFGDETLWWVFNDKGNIHTESGAESIGLEVHAQAFAFNTTDDINNMTFYNFKLFNRSSITLNDTYLGWNVDGDLGDATDDYVGCDVKRGFGYFYNGDNADGNGNGNTYGAIPPAAGIDFFQGPLADANDGKDNDRDGVIDEVGEQIIMSKFVFYSNDGTPFGDPQQANEYYNYLKGFWRNNTAMTYGGNGQNPSGQPCNFMFPWDTDDSFGNVMWNENGPPANTAADRRFVQSCGTFTLKPGAVNNVTVGAVYARATSGNERDSRVLLLAADDIAQGLFDDCFKPIDGPDAPDVSVREGDKQIVLLLSNKPTSNNYANSYDRWDRSISSFMNAKTVAGNRPVLDSTFTFEGYQVYQLKSESISVTDLDNPDLSRLVKVSDVKNGVTRIVNYEYDINTGSYIAKVKVDGSDLDQGLESSLLINTDAFNSGAPLINHKPYYFMVVAYAHNDFHQYKGDIPYSNVNTPSFEGQKLPFLRGRRNIRAITAIPSISGVANGNAAQATFGVQPQLTRVEGQGNGGIPVRLTEATIKEIVDNGKAQNLVYEKGYAPIKVKVVDPLAIQDADFQYKLLPVTDDSLALDTGKTRWSLTNLATGEIIYSEGTILYQNEQVIEKWGISVNVSQPAFPGTSKAVAGGVLESTISANNPWLRLITDAEVNWILSDISGNANYSGLDPKFNFQTVAGGAVGPYRLCSTGRIKSQYPGFAWKDSLSATNKDSLYLLNSLSNLEGIQITFTNDKSKWTRCPVIEMSDDTILAVNRAKKFSLRKSSSVDKDGNAESSTTGMGWFPGYAINTSTGERLNMAFGENSWLKTDNGADMKWNPSSRLVTPIQDSVGGGMHLVYVFGHNSSDPSRMPAYDQGAYMKSMLDKFEELWTASLAVGLTPTQKADLQRTAFHYKRMAYRDAMWVNFPILNEGAELLSTDVTLTIGMARPFRKMLATAPFSSFTVTNSNAPSAASPINNNYSVFTFSTKDLKPILDDADLKKNALGLINVVPNPYYAHSEYEKGVLLNTVRITNLPTICNITIYTNNGTIVRKFGKDSPATYLDWDLQNSVNIPVASGLYIIHVDVPGVGEKTLKWMGVMRQLDLETF